MLTCRGYAPDGGLVRVKQVGPTGQGVMERGPVGLWVDTDLVGGCICMWLSVSIVYDT